MCRVTVQVKNHFADSYHFADSFRPLNFERLDIRQSVTLSQDKLENIKVHLYVSYYETGFYLFLIYYGVLLRKK